MKKDLFAVAVLFFTTAAYSQVGINNNAPKATLDITPKTTDGSTAEGLIAPRLTGDQIKAADAHYTSDQRGAMVYATSAVTTTSTKTAKMTAEGYYYFDGSLWLPVETKVMASNGITKIAGNLQLGGALTQPTTISSVTATNKLSVTATGVDAINLAGNTLSIDAANSRVGIGTALPNAKLDIRSNPTSTSDPGAGFFGLGTTSATANAAGACALRYSTGSGGLLQYSNGTSWNTLASSVQKSIVVAKKTSTQTFPTSPSIAQSYVIDWLKTTDLNNNFDPSTGIFTAPRDGNYTVSFSFNFSFSQVNAGTQVEAIISTGGTANSKKSVVAFPSAGSSEGGAAISFTIRLAAGETVRPFIWHNTGHDKTLRVGSGDDDGFVNFSVAEL